MSFIKQATKLLTNKYFLYFMVFLSVTNVLGYLVMNKINAVVFFALIGLIMSKFSKNMAVILLVCLMSTNLLMSNKMVREGLDGPDSKVPEDVKDASDSKVPEDVKDASDKKDATPSTTVAKMEDKLKGIASKITDKDVETKQSPFTNLEPEALASEHGKKGSRIDLASTLKSQFAELNSILGPDGVKGLTTETMELMNSQKDLMNQMESMGPMLSQAQEMLKGFDMDSIGSLGDMLKKMGPNKKE